MFQACSLNSIYDFIHEYMIFYDDDGNEIVRQLKQKFLGLVWSLLNR